jgi:hypothetical protein
MPVVNAETSISRGGGSRKKVSVSDVYLLRGVCFSTCFYRTGESSWVSGMPVGHEKKGRTRVRPFSA